MAKLQGGRLWRVRETPSLPLYTPDGIPLSDVSAVNRRERRAIKKIGRLRDVATHQKKKQS